MAAKDSKRTIEIDIAKLFGVSSGDGKARVVKAVMVGQVKPGKPA